MNDREHAYFTQMLSDRIAAAPAYSRERWLRGFVRAVLGFGIDGGFGAHGPENDRRVCSSISSAFLCTSGRGS